MPRIFFVRHAENDLLQNKILAGRTPAIHLNEVGKEHARYLARQFNGQTIRAIYCSPIERTLETAKPIAEAIGLKVDLADELMEIDFGDWQNTPYQILRENKLWQFVRKAPSLVRFPSGESYIEAQYRVCSFVDSLITQYNDEEQIICVTHADVIRLAIGFYIGLPLDMIKRLIISPASISLLVISNSSAQLIMMNATTLEQ